MSQLPTYFELFGKDYLDGVSFPKDDYIKMFNCENSGNDFMRSGSNSLIGSGHKGYGDQSMRRSDNPMQSSQGGFGRDTKSSGIAK